MAKKPKSPHYQPMEGSDTKVRIMDKNGGEIVPIGDTDKASLAVRRTASSVFNSRWGFVKKFQSAQELYDEIVSYFQWADAHPVFKSELIRSGYLAGQEGTVTVGRPYTKVELMNHLGITYTAYNNYRDGANYREFHEVIQWAEGIIANRKMVGAMVGIYNPTIVSRDLGLVEKSEQEVSGVQTHVITGITVRED